MVQNTMYVQIFKEWKRFYYALRLHIFSENNRYTMNKKTQDIHVDYKLEYIAIVG